MIYKFIKIFFILLFIVVLISGIYLYFFGDKLISGPYIKKRISRIIDKEINFTKIRINILRGLELQDLSIKDNNEKFIEADKLVLSYDLFKILSGRFEITEIKIIKPTFKVIQLEQNKYNISDIIKKIEENRKEKSELKIRNVIIKDSSLLFKTRDKKTFKFDEINLELTGLTEGIRTFEMSVGKFQDMEITTEIEGTIDNADRIKVKGDLDIPSLILSQWIERKFLDKFKRLQAEFEIHRDAETLNLKGLKFKLSGFNYYLKNILDIKNEQIEGFTAGVINKSSFNIKECSFKINKIPVNIQGNVTIRDNKQEFDLNIVSRININNLKDWLILPQSIKDIKKGDLNLYVKYRGKDFYINANIMNMEISLKDTSYVKTIRNIEGSIGYIDKKIKINNLYAEILQDVKLQINGDVNNDLSSEINIRFYPADLAIILKELPEKQKNRFSDYEISGMFAANTIYKGKINDEKLTDKIISNIEISNVKISPKRFDAFYLTEPIIISSSTLSYDKGKFRFEDLKGYAAKLPFVMNGEIDISQKEPFINLNTVLNNINFRELINALNKKYTVNLSNLELEGLVNGVLNFEGTIDDLNYNASFDIEDGTISSPQINEPLKKVSLNLKLQKDLIKIRKAGFSIDNTYLNLQGDITDFDKKNLNLKLTGSKVDLKTLRMIILSDTSIDFSGDADLNVTINGSIDTPFLAGNLSFIDGYIDLANLNLKARLNDLKGDVNFNKDRLFFTGLKGRIENSEVLITGEVSNISKNISKTCLNMDIFCKKLFLNDLKSIFGDKTLGDVDGYIYVDIHSEGSIDNLLCKGRISGSHIKIHNIPFLTLGCNFNYSSETLNVFQIDGNSFGGSIDGKAEIKSLFKDKPLFNTNVSLKNAALYEVFRLYGKEYAAGIEGTINLKLNLSGNFLESKSITGEGEIELLKPRLRTLHPLIKLSDLLGLSKTRLTYYDDVKTKIYINEGLIKTPDLKFQSDYIYGEGGGSIGFDGSLDYKINLRMTEESAREHLDSKYGAKLEDNKSILDEYLSNVPVIIKGSINEPEVEYGKAGFPEMVIKSLIFYPKRFIEKIGDDLFRNGSDEKQIDK
ncbi:MAG: AsmA-like C-terminal region-containing protein [Candidatus Hydrogenedentota bacterium]